MTHRGPFQPLPFCNSVILFLWATVIALALVGQAKQHSANSLEAFGMTSQRSCQVDQQGWFSLGLRPDQQGRAAQGCDSQCQPWLWWPLNRGVPGAKGPWVIAAAEHKPWDSREDDTDVFGRLKETVAWEAAWKSEGSHEMPQALQDSLLQAQEWSLHISRKRSNHLRRLLVWTEYAPAQTGSKQEVEAGDAAKEEFRNLVPECRDDAKAAEFQHPCRDRNDSHTLMQCTVDSIYWSACVVYIHFSYLHTRSRLFG